MDSDHHDFDVALSFAGEDRRYAEELARLLQSQDVRVFYDSFERASLWGKDLYQHLQSIYRDKAKYCVVFVSQHYLDKPWPRHELHQAQARDFRGDREYILPLRLDDTELPGLNATIGYVDLRATTLEGIANLLFEKLFGPDFDQFFSDPPPSWDGTLIDHRGARVASFWPEKLRRAQLYPYYVVSHALPRIPYGSERSGPPSAPGPCHDCGALLGEFHVPSCDWEECPQCHGQALGCDCIVGYTDDKEASEGTAF